MGNGAAPAILSVHDLLFGSERVVNIPNHAAVGGGVAELIDLKLVLGVGRKASEPDLRRNRFLGLLVHNDNATDCLRLTADLDHLADTLGCAVDNFREVGRGLGVGNLLRWGFSIGSLFAIRGLLPSHFAVRVAIPAAIAGFRSVAPVVEVTLFSLVGLPELARLTLGSDVTVATDVGPAAVVLLVPGKCCSSECKCDQTFHLCLFI